MQALSQNAFDAYESWSMASTVAAAAALTNVVMMSVVEVVMLQLRWLMGRMPKTAHGLNPCGCPFQKFTDFACTFVWSIVFEVARLVSLLVLA
mmetsp:Transcript_150204/g.280144  ORF Transcript_150204/g.280144 Transcript_150204/m.280144 type:complete len:93 (-) Transcript_150204:566-844(-)